MYLAKGLLGYFILNTFGAGKGSNVPKRIVFRVWTFGIATIIWFLVDALHFCTWTARVGVGAV